MKTKILRAVTGLISVLIVSSALLVSYVILFPIDVLTNWTLEVKGDHYQLGDTVPIESHYTKNSSLPGESTRYLECRNDSDVYIRYTLTKAISDRPSGKHRSTGVVARIPDNLAEVKLPARCHFSVSIVYDAYPRRAEPEYGQSNDFTLTARSEAAKPVSLEATSDIAKSDGSSAAPAELGDSQALAAVPRPGGSLHSLSQPSGVERSASVQPAPHQSAPTPAPTQPATAVPPAQQNVVQRVVGGLIDGASNVGKVLISVVTGGR